MVFIFLAGLGGAHHPGALPSYLGVMDQTAAANPGTGVFGAIGQVGLGECLGMRLFLM